MTNKKEQTLEEKYPYAFSGMGGKILNGLKEYFWFLLIALIIAYNADLKSLIVLIVYVFFVILLMLAVLDERRRLQDEVSRTQLSSIETVLTLVAYKLKVDRDDMHKYFGSEKENEHNTEDYIESLGNTIDELAKTLKRIGDYKSTE